MSSTVFWMKILKNIEIIQHCVFQFINDSKDLHVNYLYFSWEILKPRIKTPENNFYLLPISKSFLSRHIECLSAKPMQLDFASLGPIWF